MGGKGRLLNGWLRTLALLAPTLTFVWFAFLDQRAHGRARYVGNGEKVLHLLLGISQTWMIMSAFSGNLRGLVGGAAATALLGAGDEYGYHRGLPARESDLHAKAHLALFMILALGLACSSGFPHAH